MRRRVSCSECWPRCRAPRRPRRSSAAASEAVPVEAVARRCVGLAGAGACPPTGPTSVQPPVRRGQKRCVDQDEVTEELAVDNRRLKCVLQPRACCDGLGARLAVCSPLQPRLSVIRQFSPAPMPPCCWHASLPALSSPFILHCQPVQVCAGRGKFQSTQRGHVPGVRAWVGGGAACVQPDPRASYCCTLSVARPTGCQASAALTHLAPTPYSQHMLSWARSVTADSASGDLLELYCGNGNFTVALAPNFRKAGEGL